MSQFIMRAAVFETRYRDAASYRRQSGVRRLKFQNPSWFWRRMIVGAGLAMPGSLAGLLVALLLPGTFVLYSAFIGMTAGFLAGFTWEGS